MSNPAMANPTAAVNLDFGRFVEQRRRELAVHTLPGGVVDYAFGLDDFLRRKIAATAPARYLIHMLAAAAGPIQNHLHTMEMVAVGPRQFPEIHSIAETCARKLGIGIPRLFIMPTSEMGACTFTSDDVAPIAVISSALIEALEPPQLTFVIGHECGHIHNFHGAYNVAVQNLSNPLARFVYEKMVGIGAALDLIKTIGHAKLVAGAIEYALKMFLMSWSRSAEITCDRAGLICCGDLEAAQRALAALATGGAASLRGINLDEYIRQLDQTRGSPLRFLEFSRSHPLIPKRIEALRLFAQCEVFYGWRPDLQRPDVVLPKNEIDAMCHRVLGISASGEFAATTRRMEG